MSSGSLTVPSTTGIVVCPCLAVNHNEIALTAPGKFPQFKFWEHDILRIQKTVSSCSSKYTEGIKYARNLDMNNEE